MGDEWSNDIESARDANCHVAAIPTSALLTGVRGTTSAGSTTAAMEAAQAVKLYRCVLAALNSPDDKLEEALASARTERAQEAAEDS